LPRRKHGGRTLANSLGARFKKNMTKKIISLILIVVTFSCKKEIEVKPHMRAKNIVQADTLHKLLEKAIDIDTLKYENQEPFLFLKTGHLFSKTKKHAILVSCPTDTTYRIELYKLENSKWEKKDEIDNIEVPYRQYEILLMDFNFDGFNDIYLNSTSSNGWSLSYGHLLTVGSNDKFEKHLETRNLPNMFPDKKTKTIITDSIEYGAKEKRIWNLIYRWKNGKLLYTKKIRSEEIY